MATDDTTLARIRDALEGSGRVDNDRIAVARDGEEIVLRGSVSSAEEASAAAMIAERDPTETVAVRNELRVDQGLREATTQGAGAVGAEDAAAPQRSPEVPGQPDDLTTNAEEALGENVAWDPPDAPSLAPTQAEQRGYLSRDATVPPAADEGEVADPEAVEPSAGDLSAGELGQVARAEPDDDEDR